MRIAVIGSGISGLSAAYFLSKKHTVDLFEKDNHFGGHSYTVEIPENNSKNLISLDLGFIVFNKKNYPNLLKFFDDLKVNYEKSNMSFAVSVKGTSIEYSGNGLNGLFANKLNTLNINFLRMVKEIITFYSQAEKIDLNKYKNQTLGEFLKMKRLSKYFINFHIIPMVAAIWSMPSSHAEKMPMSLFLKFFRNHGLFKIKNRPQWYTVSGRSKIYVNKVLKAISGEYFKNYAIKYVQRNKSGVRLFYGETNEYFDYEKVIFASHADETLKLIKNPTEQEKEILSNFKYKKNIAYLHNDNRLMPNNKNTWSSWNSIIEKENLNSTCITYWLNKLQNLKSENNYFLTLNPSRKIDEKKIIKKTEFFHPFYDMQAINNQKRLGEIQGQNNSWFCGSYFGYGFHEDGLNSSLNIIKKI
jgi:uncharacterized protein